MAVDQVVHLQTFSRDLHPGTEEEEEDQQISGSLNSHLWNVPTVNLRGYVESIVVQVEEEISGGFGGGGQPHLWPHSNTNTPSIMETSALFQGTRARRSLSSLIAPLF